MKEKIFKISFIIIIICVSIILKVSCKIIINKRFIANYPDSNQAFRLMLISIFNIYEPYIAPYNYGNYYYQKERYERAYEKYKKALSYNVPKKRLCSIDINIALSLIQLANDEKNEQKSLAYYQEAKDYLRKCLSIQKEEIDDDNAEDDSEISNQQKSADNLINDINNEISNKSNSGNDSGNNSDGSNGSGGGSGGSSGNEIGNGGQSNPNGNGEGERDGIGNSKGKNDKTIDIDIKIGKPKDSFSTQCDNCW